MIMRSLTASSLLSAWEKGLSMKPSQIGLMLMAYALPDVPSEELAKLSVGARDSLLLDLREDVFGSAIAGLAECPECAETLELSFSIQEIRADIGDKATPLSLVHPDYELKFRLPDSTDLKEAESCKSASDARDLILERCILDVVYKKDDQKEAPLASIGELVADIMAKADPQGDVLLFVRCTSCSHEWHIIFDIASFFWMEIDSWAHHILVDVHCLARAYGWSEREILEMSPLRRQLYLEMVNA